MSDIFISYAREDKSRAESLAKVFSSHGWSVWWDREIPPGQSFDEMIEKALHSAKCVVVLWSKDSISSRWVKTEAAEGAARGILIPVLMDKVHIPLEFKRIEAANLTDWQGALPHFEFEHLLKTVAGILSGAPSTGIRMMPTDTVRSRQWRGTISRILAATGGVIIITMLVVVLYQTKGTERIIWDLPKTQNDTKVPTEATKYPTAPGAAAPSPVREAAPPASVIKKQAPPPSSPPAQTSVGPFDGTWCSNDQSFPSATAGGPKYRAPYCFRITGNVGIATRSNSPNYAVDQKMLDIEQFLSSGFCGKQKFTDGLLIHHVCATQIETAVLRMEGEGWTWYMYKQQ